MYFKKVFVINDLRFDEDYVLERFKRLVEDCKFFVKEVELVDGEEIDIDESIVSGYGYMYVSDLVRFDNVLLEAKSTVTLKDLEDGIIRYARERGTTKRRYVGAVEVRELRLRVDVGMKTLLCFSSTVTEKVGEEKPSSYNQVIVFYDMVVSDEKTDVTPLYVDGVWIGPVIFDENPVAVRCGCDNFYFVWAKALLARGALFGGRLRKYDPVKELWKREKRKLEQELGRRFVGRLPKEVQQELERRVQAILQKRAEKPPAQRAVDYPGVCKHIWRVVEVLAENKIIRFS